MATKQRLRLGELLLSLGYLEEEHLTEALELQRLRPHSRIGEILMDLGYAQEDHVLEALSEQFGIPFEKDISGEVDASLTTKVPISFIREYRMVPYLSLIHISEPTRPY